MVVTKLQASVTEDNFRLLEREFTQAVKQLDPGIIHTELLHDMKDPTIWQIVTYWESRQALDAMRQSGETPRGILIFQAAGATPVLTIFEVVAEGMV